MSEPRWLTEARKYIGQREIPGPQTSSFVQHLWNLIHVAFHDDETPWCAGFVGGMLESVGIRSTRSAAARSYQNWGVRLAKPAVGAIVVFWRGSPQSYSGHVGFVSGIDARGNLLVLGGNQGDMVSVRAFLTTRVVSYRWPAGEPLPDEPIKTTATTGKISTNEG